MATHSLFMVEVILRPKRVGDRYDMDNLAGTGANILRVFKDMLDEHAPGTRTKNFTELSMSDETRRLYVDVTGVQSGQRWVQADLALGYYGTKGSVRNARTGTAEHDYEENSAPTTPMRVLLVCPPKATSAILIFEKVAVSSARKPIVKHFTAALKLVVGDAVAEFVTITETDAWLESAELEKLTAVYYGYSSDLADTGTPKVQGELTAVLVPTSAPGVLKKLRTKEIAPGKLLGIKGDPSQVKVQASHNGHTKTFVLGNDGTPSITEFLADAPPAPPDEVFRSRAFELARQHAEKICSATWTAAMERAQ